MELIYYIAYFSPSSDPTLVCFFPVGLSLLIQHFQHPQDLLKMLIQQRKAYKKETNKCWMVRQWKNR